VLTPITADGTLGAAHGFHVAQELIDIVAFIVKIPPDMGFRRYFSNS
jgi:hypothetical protein